MTACDPQKNKNKKRNQTEGREKLGSTVRRNVDPWRGNEEKLDVGSKTSTTLPSVWCEASHSSILDDLKGSLSALLS